MYDSRLITRLFLVVPFLVLSGLLAQAESKNETERLQSLKHDLSLAAESYDSLQMARIYRRIGVEYTYASRYDTALVYLYKALEIADALQHARATAAIYNNIAECYSKLGDSKKALNLYDEVGRIYLNIPDSAGYAGFLINLAAELQDLGETANAVEKAILAIQVKEQVGDSVQLAFFYNKLSELLEKTNPIRSRELLFKAYKLTHNPKYTAINTNITIYNNLARIYSEQGDYALAFIYHDSVYLISNQHGHHDGMEVSLSNQAMLYAKLGNIEEALGLHKRAIQISEKGQNVFRRTGHYVNAGKLEIRLGNYKEAITPLNNGLRLAIEYNFPGYIKEALHALTQAYRANDQFELALDAFTSYTRTKDSLENVEIKSAIAELEKQYESQKKAKQIELLQAESLHHKKRRKILNVLLIISVFFLFSLGLILRLRYNRLKQQMILANQKKEIYKLNQENLNLKLDRKNRELSSMALQMVQKHEFLQDFHDKIKNSNPENIQSYITQIDNQLNQNGEWETFRLHFEEVHPDFFRKLKSSYPTLTPNEEKLCAYLKMNLSSKEISLINNSTIAAVDKSRNRLRKKLDINAEQNLRDFLERV
jgi:tetratricopeptide (TPR) repeat protein